MRLYHNPFSSNARRAVMTALHVGANVELSVVDLKSGAQRAPEYLAKNPNGKVPVLVEDDGFTLWESHAIMQYIADKTPGHTLYPSELRARADVNRWLFWNANHWQPAISVLNWEHFVKQLIGLGSADPRELARGEKLIKENAAVLDAHLADKEWLAQGRLTLADFAVASPLMVLKSAKLPIDHPNLLKWLDRVQALDAWKKTSL